MNYFQKNTIKIFISILIAGLGIFLYNKTSKLKVYVPKPVGYPRVVLPHHAYVPLSNRFPYRFERSIHTEMIEKSGPNEKYFITLRYPTFKADLLLTYKPVHSDPKLLQEYCRAAHELTKVHHTKAYAVYEQQLQTRHGSRALIIDIKGEVCSPVQFYVTDGKHHFLRGALYFSTSTHNEYLEPVITFIREDILHLLSTLSWR